MYHADLVQSGFYFESVVAVCGNSLAGEDSLLSGTVQVRRVNDEADSQLSRFGQVIRCTSSLLVAICFRTCATRLANKWPEIFERRGESAMGENEYTIRIDIRISKDVDGSARCGGRSVCSHVGNARGCSC